MRELSLFTGAGGGIYGSKLLGWETIGYVEYDDYCQRVLRQRIEDKIFERAPIFTDIRTFSIYYAEKYRGMVDVVTAGFPCQPFSLVGKHLASSDDRNMWPATLDILKKVRPKWALLENVSGVLGKHGYFGTILKDLAENGYDAEWVCISAGGMGAPHKRERVWVVATDTTSNGLEAINKSGGRGKVPEKGLFPSVTRDTGSLGRWWENEPRMGRMANGVADWSNRIKALGNGQVPIVVREAWETLIGYKEAP